MEAKARATGVPDRAIAIMLGYYRAAHAGEFDVLDGTLAKILGRAPQTMATFLKENL
jgi:hypothetical protein